MSCHRSFPARAAFRRSLQWGLVFLGAAALMGCSRVGGDATQVAAKVNDTEISLAQLQHVLQRQPIPAPNVADANARRVLDGVVDHELAAQGARQLGLDKDPRIVQAMEEAKREVLARSYHEALAEKAALPSSDEIDRYYDSQPALFAQRRFYSLQELPVEGGHAELAALQASVEAAASPDLVADILRGAKIPFTARHLTVSPEDVPLPLLGKLADLRAGQSLMLPQRNGARVLTLLSSSPAPLAREAARPAIQAYLTNERKRQAVQDGLKALRESARIEYRGKFAKVASQPAKAGSAPPSP